MRGVAFFWYVIWGIFAIIGAVQSVDARRPDDFYLFFLASSMVIIPLVAGYFGRKWKARQEAQKGCKDIKRK